MEETCNRPRSAKELGTRTSDQSQTACQGNKDIAARGFDSSESVPPSHDHPIGENTVKLSQTKKWSLLAVFSLGIFIDIWMYSAFYVFTGPIAIEFEVPFEQQTWIITSYAVTFAAFLLFWGRVSDLASEDQHNYR